MEAFIAEAPQPRHVACIGRYFMGGTPTLLTVTIEGRCPTLMQLRPPRVTLKRKDQHTASSHVASSIAMYCVNLIFVSTPSERSSAVSVLLMIPSSGRRQKTQRLRVALFTAVNSNGGRCSAEKVHSCELTPVAPATRGS